MKRKTALITGSGAGIGKAIALELAKENCDIVAADIDLAAAEQTAEEAMQMGVRAIAVRCNVSDVDQIEYMFAQIKEKMGALDILVNNAGIANNIPIEDMSEKDWDTLLDINLKGAFFCSKHAYMMMKENGGSIVNMSSIAGERGGLYAGVNYSASKGGILAMTKAFALSGAKYGITVNAIAPGTVETAITKRLGHKTDGIPLGKMAKPEDIANAVVFLTSENASYITGMTLDINGGQLMR